jgi:RHS repeat-associated protein
VQTGSVTTEFIHDFAGRRISSWLSPSNYGSEGRIYWGGQQVAYRSTDGTTYFDHQDTLGTERGRTNYAGSAGSTYVSMPWGDGYTATVYSSGADQDNEHFAGLERDAESGTEHAQFRNYTSNQGRWLVPDQYMGSYDFTNPQSMNRYAYVLNNPASMVDPSGLFTLPTGPCDPDVSDCDTDPDPGDPCAGFFGCGWPWLPPIPPVNPGQPYVFKVYTGRQIPNFALQRSLLLTIPFATSAPSNSTQKMTQQCLQEFYNSGAGKAVNFMSLGSLVPGWGPDPMASLEEWGLAIIGKGGGGTAAVALLNRYNTQTITTLAGSTTIGSSVGNGLAKLLHFSADVGSGAMVAATGIDLLVHAGCANSALNASGQANIPMAPTVF